LAETEARHDAALAASSASIAAMAAVTGDFMAVMRAHASGEPPASAGGGRGGGGAFAKIATRAITTVAAYSVSRS
jgi:hypothetical protein